MQWKVAAVLLMPLTVLWFIYALGQQQPLPDVCLEPHDRERIRVLTLEAFDKAFREKAEQLMDTWIKDTRDQPDRAMAGMDRSIRVYSRARSQALAWNPPTC